LSGATFGKFGSAKIFHLCAQDNQAVHETPGASEYVISRQLLRSGTSIGANVAEATAGQSRRDFLAKMSIASKEARETKYWLQLLDESDLAPVDVSDELRDVEELIRILTSIVKTTSEHPQLARGISGTQN
jgi:four helix bundle protein